MLLKRKSQHAENWLQRYLYFHAFQKCLKGLCIIEYINMSLKTTYYTVSRLETTKKPIEKESFDVKDEKRIRFMNRM